MNTSIDQLNTLVWKRFIRMPYGHLLDYADMNGETSIPTPEECKDCNPNPLGWWTPIENGSFFGGLYVTALLHRHALSPDDALKEQIHTLIHGLKLNQDVGTQDGFIARGVASDGISHYPCSSEDQVTPWILGMFTYFSSPLCEEQEEIRERLLRTLRGIRNHQWSIPFDAPYAGYTNQWINAADWRGVCKMLFCAYLIYVLTGDPKDLAHYIELRDGKPGKSIYARWQIASHGFAHDMVRNTGLIQLWIDVCAHQCLRYLSQHDEDHAADYRNGCMANGVTALCFVSDIQKYDNISGGFDLNWRAISYLRKPFDGNMSAVYPYAGAECNLWSENVVPHRQMEHEILGNALFSAWIALTCDDEAIQSETKRLLNELLDTIDWDTLTVSYAFVAESCLTLAAYIH